MPKLSFTFIKDKRTSKPKECEKVVIEAPSNYDKRRCDRIEYTITAEGIRARIMKGNVEVGNFAYTSLNKNISKIALTNTYEQVKSFTGKVEQ